MIWFTTKSLESWQRFCVQHCVSCVGEGSEQAAACWHILTNHIRRPSLSCPEQSRSDHGCMNMPRCSSFMHEYIHSGLCPLLHTFRFQCEHWTD